MSNKSKQSAPSTAKQDQAQQASEDGSLTAPASGATVPSQEAAPGGSSEEAVVVDAASQAGDAFVSAFTPPGPAAPPEPPVLPPKMQFRIQVGPVMHDGVVYRDGDAILLTFDEAVKLIRNGCIKIKGQA